MSDAWTDGAAYDRFMGRWSRVLAPMLVAWARIPRGGSVLDVGCGTGSLTRALLEAGAVWAVGVDASPAFVGHCTSTFGGEASPASFEVSDAMRLPFPDRTFDAAASCLVLNFIPEPARAAREMARVVRDGGVLAACVWDYGERMEMLRWFWDAAVTLDLPGAKEWDEGTRFPIRSPDALAALFGEVGSRVETAPLDVPMTFRDFDDYWSPFLAGIGPSGGFVVSLSDGDRARMREHLCARLPTGPDGSIRLVSRAWAVRAVKE